MVELPLPVIDEIMLQYLLSGRSIRIDNCQERQGNSTEWENDIEEFLKGLSYGPFERGQNPDFGFPYNMDIKTIRSDRKAKTFSISAATAEQAESGILPYRTVVLVWRYDEDFKRGFPEDAVIIPNDTRTVLSNWSYGIQIKTGISDSLLQERGLLSRAVNGITETTDATVAKSANAPG